MLQIDRGQEGKSKTQGLVTYYREKDSGGGDGSRTHVRKTLSEKRYMLSLC